MTLAIQFMDRGRAVSVATRRNIVSAVNEGIKHIEKYCSLDNIDLIIVPTDVLNDPRWFRSGRCWGGHFAEIYVNPEHPLFASNFASDLPCITMHEINHCLRWRHVSKWTLGECVALEGLARCAELTHPLGATQDWGTPPDDVAMAGYIERTLVEMNEESWSDYQWIYDPHPDDEVKLIYHIGHQLIQRTLDRLLLDPFSAVSLPMRQLLTAGSN